VSYGGGGGGVVDDYGYRLRVSVVPPLLYNSYFLSSVNPHTQLLPGVEIWLSKFEDIERKIKIDISKSQQKSQHKTQISFRQISNTKRDLHQINVDICYEICMYMYKVCDEIFR
jgi:hypothetical protein